MFIIIVDCILMTQCSWKQHLWKLKACYIPSSVINKSTRKYAHLQKHSIHLIPHTHYRLVRSVSHVFRDGLLFFCCLNAELFFCCRTLRLSLWWWWWWAPQHSPSLNIILVFYLHISTHSHFRLVFICQMKNNASWGGYT